MSEPIKDAWRTYQREEIPPGAPEAQQDACRRAFYAGAFALFRLVLDASQSEATVAAAVEHLVQELQDAARDHPPPPCRGTGQASR